MCGASVISNASQGLGYKEDAKEKEGSRFSGWEFRLVLDRTVFALIEYLTFGLCMGCKGFQRRFVEDG